MKATALISGVVDEVFVLETEAFEGDIIATLVDDDAELGLAAAEASLVMNLGSLVMRPNKMQFGPVSMPIQKTECSRGPLGVPLEEADRFAIAGPEGIPETTIIESRQRLWLSGRNRDD